MKPKLVQDYHREAEGRMDALETQNSGEVGKDLASGSSESVGMKFQDYLAEQMKDPEFKAAYEAIAEEEAKQLLTAALVEIVRMKPIVEAACKAIKAERAFGAEPRVFRNDLHSAMCSARCDFVAAVDAYEEPKP